MATKKIIEKKTGEKYASKAAMAKHEKKEGKAEQMKEYGKVKSPMKQVGTPRPATKTRPTAAKVDSPAMMKKVTKKTAYDIKEASNQKLSVGARKHYAENAQAAMKEKKSPVKQVKPTVKPGGTAKGKATAMGFPQLKQMTKGKKC